MVSAWRVGACVSLESGCLYDVSLESGCLYGVSLESGCLCQPGEWVPVWCQPGEWVPVSAWRVGVCMVYRGFSRPQWQICGRKICSFPQFTANFVIFPEKSQFSPF